MVEFTPNDIILVIGAGAAAIGSIWMAITRSRCSNIECCCIKCQRDVPPVVSPKKQSPRTIEPVHIQDVV